MRVAQFTRIIGMGSGRRLLRAVVLPPEGYEVRNARYFFHVHDGKERPDRDGVELTGPDQARKQAVVVSGEALKDLDGVTGPRRG